MGPFGLHDQDISQNAVSMAHRYVPEFDAFQDNPWPIIFKQMDQAYPGSKFILTLREQSLWLESAVRHFGEKETSMRKWIYGVGSPKGHEDIYIRRYATHNHDVLEYFKERPGDLLVMDFSQGDGWAQLCSFLERPVPTTPFPHANKSSDRLEVRRRNS